PQHASRYSCGTKRGLSQELEMAAHRQVRAMPSTYHSCCDAMRAPAAIDAILAHAICGSTAEEPAIVPKPQSVPAITFSRPTTPATLQIRCATSSGCSMKLVTESITPGIRIL